MQDIPAQLVENVFPEERTRFYAFVKRLKRNLRAWLIVITACAIIYFVANIQTILPFLMLNYQYVLNVTFIAWIIAIVVTPVLWPQKPGDIFSDDFSKGINPRTWDYAGLWKAELDESGKPVLTVTKSDFGGIALPCLSWTDYELVFETRIMQSFSGWLVRASSLNEGVMIQISDTLIRPHYRSNAVDQLISSNPHNAPIKLGKWFLVQILVRGAWVKVSITIDKKDYQVLQEQILGTRPPVFSEITFTEPNTNATKTFTSVGSVSYRSGTFGFRQSGPEKAQFKNVKAYKLH